MKLAYMALVIACAAFVVAVWAKLTAQNNLTVEWPEPLSMASVPYPGGVVMSKS